MGNSCGGGAGKVSALTTHTIYVKTGDKKGAETDGNIFVCMADEAGKWSDESLLDIKWKIDFERGNTDVFNMESPGLGKIKEILIRRDETSATDAWYLEKVEIEHLATGKLSVFPVTRWLSAKDELYLSEYDSRLPQDDKYKDQRAKEIAHNREVYAMKERAPGMPAQSIKLPEDEEFSDRYKFDLAMMSKVMKLKIKYISFTTPNFDSLDDFNQIYRNDILPHPTGRENWRDEEEFGNQRLSGANPTTLRICRDVPDDFAVTPQMVERFLEGRTFYEAMGLGKIYVVDHRYMADLPIAGAKFKVCGPIGMFYVKKNGHMVAIAIQLMPKPADDNPVFLPDDPEFTWQMAKMYFNLADSSHHSAATHLGLTHIIMETAVCCVRRTMSPSHPLVRLMAPHFLYLLAINHFGLAALINEGGFADNCIQIQKDGMLEIAAYQWKDWTINENGNLRKDLKRRGVDDSDALPNYHYRDDALLLWDAIWDYVSSVVNSVYDQPKKLADDWELQAWAKELKETKFMKSRDSFGTNEQVVECVSVLIFTSSVQHAAVNFGQYDEYAFPPNYPLKMVGERPKDKTALTEEDVVKSLPNKTETMDVLIMVHLLSERGTNVLGKFEMQYAYDPISLEALKKFQAKLEEISHIVEERNSKRLRKYTYLNPKEIPNSIGI